MSSSPIRRLLIASILLALPLSAFVTFMAQSARRETNSANDAGTVLTEKDRETRNRNKLASLLLTVGLRLGSAPADFDTTYRELRIHWESRDQSQPNKLLKDTQASTEGLLSKTSSIDRAGVLPRERSLEFSSEQMLVVALDESGAVRWWKLMTDPRLLRAEVGSSNEMRSENYYRAETDFIIASPAHPSLRQLRFYRLQWDGVFFDLQAIGGDGINLEKIP